MSHDGKAIIISAPSGSGKTTIVTQLLPKIPSLAFSVSACTRKKRDNIEKSGEDYYFFSLEEFRRMIKSGAFIEWEEVYPGQYYGTLKSEVERIWDQGKHVVFDVDVKGALNLKKHFKERALAIFVKVHSMEVLKERLSHRRTESNESLDERLKKAAYERSFEDQFDVTVLNDDLDSAVESITEQINSFLSK